MKYLTLILSCLCIPAFLMAASPIRNGAEQIEKILPLLREKRIALVVNQTSMVHQTHLLDTLHHIGLHISQVFAPEHGFRGDADAGESIKNGTDSRTGIPIISLYGKNKKPQPNQLSQTDVVVFDIQDVGARFYTYISTLYYVMQACAENQKEVIVLDRPNPCDYVAGPVLDMKYKSFVGMLPIPLLHGCTVGELARMINGEQWLGNKLKCNLTVITVEGWKHGEEYSLPVKPSPNLPNDQAISLYPSLCPFEGTSVSIGRGTLFPFQAIGSPHLSQSGSCSFTFKPVSLQGFDKNPLHKNLVCYGSDLRQVAEKGFTLKYVINLYQRYKKQGIADKFFTRPHWFDLLMGTNQVRIDLINGEDEAAIKAKWQPSLLRYQQIRSKYLLYEDTPHK